MRRKYVLNAEASFVDNMTNRRIYHKSVIETKSANNENALKKALKEIQQRYPNCDRHGVTIQEAYK